MFFSFTLACSVAAAQESNPLAWTPELSMQFKRLQGTAISADGSHIAYVVNSPLMEGEQSEFQTQIWVVTADGNRNVQYTQNDASASAPAFSPDGQYLSFLSKRGESEGAKTQLWLMPLFGGEARQLTDAANDVTRHQWSSQGDRIAFTMQDPLSEQRQKEIDEKRDVILVDQQPRYRHLHVVRVNTSAAEPAEPVQITSGELVVGSFDWSPAGDEIVFDHKVNPDINLANLLGDIAVVAAPAAASLDAFNASNATQLAGSEGNQEQMSEDAAGTKPHQILGEMRTLVNSAGVESNPRWSPDGDWIAYSSTGAQPELIGLNDIYVIPANGGDSRRLALSPDRNAVITAWSPDSSEMFLTEAVGTTRTVLALPLRGENIRRLFSDEGVVRNLSVARNADKLTYSKESPDTPWDLYAASTTDTSQPTRLTHLHKDINTPTMGKTEFLNWTSADGIEIEGLLTYPVNYQAGQAVPIILNVHGGPSGVYSESFTGGPSTYMIQYFAQQGYAILRPNPRGSTGYGFEFRAATDEDWGQGDLNDLLTGLDKVIEMGIGDPDNQFLMGWSYGGFMTSYAVTQTDRFKAASMGAGISNLVSMSTTTDIRDYLFEHMGGFYWDVMDTFQRSSAINHIDQVVTPTQVIHGQEDLRVPLSQSQEFYRALKYRGIDTEMIVYPRTPHGPREPKFLMDVSQRISTWFNHYRH